MEADGLLSFHILCVLVSDVETKFEISPLFFFFSKCYESYQCSQAALIYGNPKKHPKQTSLMRHDADGESYSKKDVLPDHFTGLRIEWENEQRKGKNPRGSFFCFFFTENFRKHETKVCFLSFSWFFFRVLKERKKDLYSPPSEEAADWKKTKRDMSEKLPSWPPALRKTLNHEFLQTSEQFCFFLGFCPWRVCLCWVGSQEFGTLNAPIDLRVGGPTAVHTSLFGLQFLVPSSTHAHAHTSTSPTVCIPANCSHIDKSSSRQWAEEAVSVCDGPPLTCKWSTECFTHGRRSLTTRQKQKKKGKVEICICSAYEDLKTEQMLSLEVESEDKNQKKKKPA